MSQLRKSASFRSRIPVRRNRFPQRRFCSPPAISTSILLQGQVKKTNCSSRNIGHNSSLDSRKRYSSSSFSSSDESYESEAPHRRLIAQAGNNHQLQQHQQHQQQHQNHEIQNGYHTSTDAISLDGLLDSVSSGGSFSSPQRSLTPDKCQNTKMQKSLHNNASYDSMNKNVTKFESNVEHGLNNNNNNNNSCINSVRNPPPHSIMKDFEFANQLQQRPPSSPALSRGVEKVDFIMKSSSLNNNPYSDEDNSKIENFKINSENDNCYSNVDLLTPLRSPRSSHRQWYNNQHQQRIFLQQKKSHPSNYYSQSQQQQQQQQLQQQLHHHQQKVVKKIKSQASVVTSSHGIILKNNCPSGMPSPAPPSRVSSTKVISSATAANHPAHHHHHHHKFHRDQISFKDISNCSSASSNNNNNNNNNGGNGNGGVRKIIHRRDDNLNLDKFKTKKIIRPSRKLENILASGSHHPVTATATTRQDNNDSLLEIENDNDGGDVVDDDDDVPKKFPRELNLTQNNAAVAVAISVNNVKLQKQLQQQQRNQKLKDNITGIGKQDAKASGLSDGKMKMHNSNWQNNSNVNGKLSAMMGRQTSDYVNNVQQSNVWNRQRKDNIKSNRNCNLSLQKMKTQSRLCETSSSSFEHINIGGGSVKKTLARSPSAERGDDQFGCPSNSGFGQSMSPTQERWRGEVSNQIQAAVEPLKYAKIISFLLIHPRMMLTTKVNANLFMNHDSPFVHGIYTQKNRRRRRRRIRN